MKKKLLAVLLCVTLLFTLATPTAFASAKNVYTQDRGYGKVFTAEKLSNPTTGEGEVDGLEAGGDRLNSYAWSMGELEDRYGDYIYIGSNRNILYGGIFLGLAGSGNEELNAALVDLVSNGELDTDCTAVETNQAAIVRYNVKTGKMETYFDSADYNSDDNPEYALSYGFRAVKNFKGALYFASTSLYLQTCYIYRISNNRQDKPEVVFKPGVGDFLRAMAVSADGNTMFVGGTVKQDVQGTDWQMAVYQTTDGVKYDMIADASESVFTRYENNTYRTSGGDVWDMLEYNGELILTLMTTKGGMVFKGHEASAEEKEAKKANKYGWVWEEIAGESQESPYGPGFGNIMNYALTPYLYKQKVYFIGFSNAMDAIINATNGLMKYLGKYEGTSINTFLDSLEDMEAVMKNETAVFRMDAEGKVEMVVGDPGNCNDNIKYVGTRKAGFNDADMSTTVYNWRADVYNDKLYIGTMDCYPLYKYITKLTNGDLLGMSKGEFRQQLEYVKAFLELLMTPEEEEPEVIEEPNENQEPLQSLMSAPLTAQPSEEKTYTTMEAVKSAADFYYNPTQSEQPMLKAIKSPVAVPPERLTDAAIEALFNILVRLQQNADKEAVTAFISDMLLSVPDAKEKLDALGNYLKFLKERCPEDSDYEKAIGVVISLVNGLNSALDEIDEDGLARYVRISDTIAANNKPGFELYCTRDGVHFETVTLDGFGDGFNYGCRTLLATDNGLMVGTANPFYGAQLWKVTDGDEKKDPTDPPAPIHNGGSTSAITVPVSGNNNVVKADVTISGTTASMKEIKNSDLDKVTGGDSVEIDMSGLKKNIDTVKIPTAAVKKIADKGGISVKLTAATVTFDKKAAQEISAQADGKTVQLIVDEIDEASLNTNQKETVRKLDTDLIIDVYLVSDGTRLCSGDKGGFGSGHATVVLPYEIKNNRTSEDYSVYYLNDEGNLEKLNARYETRLGAFVFDVSHFSKYLIAYTEKTYANCTKDADCPIDKFIDTKNDAWWHDGIHFCLENGLMVGVSDTQFAPAGTITRGMIVTMLWRLDGKKSPNYAMTFKDVPASQWYTEAVRWAAAEKIVSGYNAERFGADDAVTREQLATILCNYAKYKGQDCTVSRVSLDYVDRADISSWANEAVKWCSLKGIVNGKDGKVFDPQGKATRAEAAAMMQRFCEVTE